MEDVSAYLGSLDETHNPASVEDAGFAKLPDDEYQARLDKLYINRSKKGKVQTVWEFEVMSGPHAFRKIMKFSGMDTNAGLDFLTRDLRNVGIDNFRWSTVQEQFGKPLDKLFLLKLQTKEKNGQVFQSIYILKGLNPDEIMKSDALDDVPF